ncbi:hypothetical protein GCM10028778_01060 [Barrientosiimonas marina]|uniref:Lipoprotein n=1 Tax=Lentibacillus kimchii TaxID=1542911 RepID=A0ABW2UU80_9BACI
MCSGCTSESDGLIPDNNYAQLFIEKKLSEDVEYKKIWNKEKLNKVRDSLNSVSVESPGSQKTKEIKNNLNEKGAYILSFLTQKDLDNRTTESVFYLALLENGRIVYSDHNDHDEMRIRLMSVKKKPKLVKGIIEKLYNTE